MRRCRGPDRTRKIRSFGIGRIAELAGRKQDSEKLINTMMVRMKSQGRIDVFDAPWQSRVSARISRKHRPDLHDDSVSGFHEGLSMK